MTTKADADEARRLRVAADLRRYEADNDIVPGTASHDGKTARGGVEWEGAARMALARKLCEIPLTRRDRDALDRHPRPRSSFTGETLDVTR